MSGNTSAPNGNVNYPGQNRNNNQILNDVINKNNLGGKETIINDLPTRPNVQQQDPRIQNQQQDPRIQNQQQDPRMQQQQQQPQSQQNQQDAKAQYDARVLYEAKMMHEAKQQQEARMQQDARMQQEARRVQNNPPQQVPDEIKQHDEPQSCPLPPPPKKESFDYITPIILLVIFIALIHPATSKFFDSYLGSLYGSESPSMLAMFGRGAIFVAIYLTYKFIQKFLS
jgi:hypothetical protein